MPRGGKRNGAGRKRGSMFATELVTKSYAITRAHELMVGKLAAWGSCSDSEVVRAAITLAYLSRRREDEAG